MIPVFYATDILVFMVLGSLLYLLYRLKKSEILKLKFRRVFERPRYWVALIILSWFAMIGFLDSLHFKKSSESYEIMSMLDFLVSPRNHQFETTYSAPFSIFSYSTETLEKSDGSLEETKPRLKYAGQELKNPEDKAKDITWRFLKGLGVALLFLILFYGIFYKKIKKYVPKSASFSFWFTLSFMVLLTTSLYFLMFQYHIFGTDKVGHDVFYEAIKSIRTGLVIGTVTTLVMLPFALFFGMWAGYFQGIVDDVIQYIYTTLSSIPAVLLIAAAVLSFQVKIEANPELRLLLLCIILGVTSWIGLCRLLRGETLKLRETEFVQAAVTLGVTHFRIIRRHILPNLLHIVVITTAIDFSGLVLAEAVLSFVGVGVDPATFSFGNMINESRLEMARDPLVWWTLCGAFVFMFALVFSANIVADAVQEALNPREK